MAAVAERLGTACPTMPPQELQILVESVVLEVARYTLFWIEASSTPPTGAAEAAA